MANIVFDFINGKLVGLPIGDVNGIAGLDSGGKVPSSQLPASVVGAMNYKGTWNASTNSPALASGVGTQGYYYKVSVAGTTSIDGNAIWDVGDFIAYDGTTWDKFEGNIGTFTTNYIPKAISAGTLGNSLIQDSGTQISINGSAETGLIATIVDTSTNEYTTGLSKYNANANGAGLQLYHARGTQASPTATLSGDTVGGNIGFHGYGTSNVEGAAIRAVAGSLWSDTNAETYFTFSTTASGSITSIERMRILSNGGISIPDTTFASQVGIIYKGIDRFIHNFNYGNNGTVTTVGFNTFVGVNAGNFTMGSTATGTIHASYNTFLGYNSGASNMTGYYNTFSGVNSGYSNTTGYSNTFSGVGSGYSNTTGYSNLFSGFQSGYSNGTGTYNTFSGYGSGWNITTTSFNTFSGANSGRFLTDGATANQTSSSSVFLGYDTRASVAANTNEIVIGASAIGNGSNTATIGNSSLLRTYLSGINLKVGTATAGTSPFKFTLTSAILLTTPEAGAMEPDSSGNLYITNSTAARGQVLVGRINTQTGITYTVAATDYSIISNYAGIQTLTLPTASTYPGRVLNLRTITANTVVSNASNVVPLAGGAATTAILAATAGKWATLISDGTNWQISAAN